MLATQRFVPPVALVVDPVNENGDAYIYLYKLSEVENTNAAIWRTIKNPPVSLAKKAVGIVVARANYKEAGYTVCPDHSQYLYKEDFTREEWDILAPLFSYPAPSIDKK